MNYLHTHSHTRRRHSQLPASPGGVRGEKASQWSQSGGHEGHRGDQNTPTNHSVMLEDQSGECERVNATRYLYRNLPKFPEIKPTLENKPTHLFSKKFL